MSTKIEPCDVDGLPYEIKRSYGMRYQTRLEAELVKSVLDLVDLLDPDEYEDERTLEYAKALIGVQLNQKLVEGYESGNM